MTTAVAMIIVMSNNDDDNYNNINNIAFKLNLRSDTINCHDRVFLHSLRTRMTKKICLFLIEILVVCNTSEHRRIRRS